MSQDQHVTPLSDIEIAQAAEMEHIRKIADKLGIDEADLLPYGHHKAKVSLGAIKQLKDRPNGKLILVAGITPTPAGEGKTTTSIGLVDGLRSIGKNASVCLREPSLGPCFGIKGGAAGGGYAQVVPMEDINLHFTGDMHAISAAHNLLAAMLDNHIHWNNDLGIDSRRITWRRVVDMNDRALRQIVNGLGGVPNGFPRSDGFDITVASEVMAIFCLAKDLDDLQRRLGNIVVGYTRDMKPVHAHELDAHGAMTALLRDAIQPNLVQTLEHTPAFVHGGPFANIAHGCNSVLATTTALKLSDYVITEAGFGADLGAEKFFDIKCRKSGLKPDCAVITATCRALKMHGGVALENLANEDLGALSEGVKNLYRHVENTKQYGIPVVVAINRFSSDTDAELELIKNGCAELGVSASICEHWAYGSRGTQDLANTVVSTIEENPGNFKVLYEDDVPLWDKIKTVAQKIYHAEDIIADKKVRDQIAAFQADGYGHYPVCIAKTPLSFTTDPKKKGIPKGHVVPIREVRLLKGAEFVVVICGDVMTMPGLPRVPQAVNVGVNADGEITGLS